LAALTALIFAVLIVPVALATPPSQTEGIVYTIQKDDWLSKLADKYLGDVLAYPAIVCHNNLKAQEDSTYTWIDNPDFIEVGWIIYIPSAEEAEAGLCQPPRGLPLGTVLTLEDILVEPETVEVNDRQSLRLDVVKGEDPEEGRLHFRLEIDAEAYPDGDDFMLTVQAISQTTIFDACKDDEEPPCDEYPEVYGVTGDGRLLIGVGVAPDYTDVFTANNPYTFDVTGIGEFTKPISVSISVNQPEGVSREDWVQQPHGLFIYHQEVETGETRRFPAILIQDSLGNDLVFTNTAGILFSKADGD
jgi:hypothetical protein